MTEYVDWITHAFAIKIANQLLYGSPIPKAVKITVTTSETGEYDLSIYYTEKTENLNTSPFYKGALFRALDFEPNERNYTNAKLIDEDNGTIANMAIAETKPTDYIAQFEFEIQIQFEGVCHEVV